MFINVIEQVKLVYQLTKKLSDDPDYMKLIQSVSLDETKPNVGLSACDGLFGSEEWWGNINNGVIKSSLIVGEIIRLYKSGQGSKDINSIDLLLPNGEIFSESIYVNDKKDKSLFSLNKKVYIFYVHNKRKFQPNFEGEVFYSNTVVEMAISI